MASSSSTYGGVKDLRFGIPSARFVVLHNKFLSDHDCIPGLMVKPNLPEGRGALDVPPAFAVITDPLGDKGCLSPSYDASLHYPCKAGSRSEGRGLDDRDGF
jgi:hypothetical protein